MENCFKKVLTEAINVEEDLYLEYVREKAKEKSKIFMLDSGEGNDYFDQERGWDIEDLSGWLIDEAQIEKFDIERKNGNAYDSFGEDYCFAKWYKDKNGSISIEFKKC